ncbi:MAG TPA: BlaI/MecI/CopY family transcriptional regulator [Terriglobia bacterium]|nr:BlaI/MecI/CopY family transcriptional regulator [Terriglobia bacterium]
MSPRNIAQRPTDAELEILNILWTTGPATVRHVHESLSKTKPSQYTTTLKLMQIMAEKGILDRDESERSHVYAPALSREDAQRRMAGHLMTRAFGGSLRSLVVGALGGRAATKSELAELRQLIAEFEEKNPEGRNARKGKTR